MVIQQKILVTGSDGQLGMELPLDNTITIQEKLQDWQPQYIINCAAYTAVDKAESEMEQAFAINADAAGSIALYCENSNARLIHISTDYVFDGRASVPYTEEAIPNPQSVYGFSKLEGEQQVMRNNPDAIIIRTAWVYSEFGKNFVKTMLRLMKEKEEIGVVNDQQGTPTNAADLASAIMAIIASQQWRPGIYHFSNLGSISWYEFALAIKELSKSRCKVNPIPSASFPTPAKRPAYSVLDKTKIQESFGIRVRDWKESLSGLDLH
jgi:dTDP-4-dehydrorhamnose reductase